MESSLTVGEAVAFLEERGYIVAPQKPPKFVEDENAISFDFLQPTEATGPKAFPIYGSSLAYDYCCPKCTHVWSGNPLAGDALRVPQEEDDV